MATGAERRHSELTRMLEQRRRAILSDVRQEVREASEDTSMARAGEVRDTVDEIEVMLQNDVRFALLTMKTQMAVRIDRALERLTEGSYGTCDDCGDEIAEARLRALPFAERCRPCEESREDVERQRPVRARTRIWRVGEFVNSAGMTN